jgi:hypothetical protein
MATSLIQHVDGRLVGSQTPQQGTEIVAQLSSKAAPKRGLKHKEKKASRQNQQDHHLHSENPVNGTNENTEEAHATQHQHRTGNDNAKENVHHQHHDKHHKHHKHHKEHTKQYKNVSSMGSGRHHENSKKLGHHEKKAKASKRSRTGHKHHKKHGHKHHHHYKNNAIPPSSALACSCQSEWGETACDKWTDGTTNMSWKEQACAQDCCIALYIQHDEETFAEELELEGAQGLNDMPETIRHHYEVVAQVEDAIFPATVHKIA